jgi:Na+/proline symporter
MTLHPIDIGIIVVYVVGVICMGFLFRKVAGQDVGSYFLAGRRIPWYALGISNAASMFDITGTMWLVTVLFVYGLKGAWLPWLWPTFNQVFLMVYLSVWIRRSGVITGAQWLTTRFGRGRGLELSRLSIVIFALVSVVGFLSYDFQGVGRFASVILPWDLSSDTYAILLMGITTIYVVLGGMYSVVVTDVIQFILLVISCISISYVAMKQISPADISAVIPHGWDRLFFGWRLDLDWGQILPEVNKKIAADGYSLFAIVWMMILFKGVLVSLAGPAPNYDMQRILAGRTARESALMSAMVPVALFPRYMMVAAFTVIGLVFFQPNLRAMGANIDFEKLMPYVIHNLLPVGVIGIVIAGLLAAFMSTFDSTVNAGAAYIVNDLYLRYIKPDASERATRRVNYLASFVVVLAGIAFGLMSASIHSVMQFIVSGLYGGYAAPNILKWHWWRFNAYGYFWGMISGIGLALLFPLLFPGVDMLYLFPLILLVSGGASVVASLLTPPEDEQVLKSFYKTVRPWGLWRPIHEKVVAEDPSFVYRTSWKRDLVNVVVGIVWQFTIMMTAIYIVLERFGSAALCATLVLGSSLFLRQNWYRKLEA